MSNVVPDGMMAVPVDVLVAFTGSAEEGVGSVRFHHQTITDLCNGWGVVFEMRWRYESGMGAQCEFMTISTTHTHKSTLFNTAHHQHIPFPPGPTRLPSFSTHSVTHGTK